jgi:transcriptional regulator with XRE-family HTH domain
MNGNRVTLLRKLREEKGLSLFTVGSIARVRDSALSNFERRLSACYPGYRKRLAEFYGLPESALFDERNFARFVEEAD